MTDRKDILDSAASLIGGERQQDYGSAADNFARIGNLWAEILGVPVSPVQVALCMNQVKVARLVSSPDHLDSWVDGAGYLAIGGEIATDTAVSGPQLGDVVVPRVVERLSYDLSGSEWMSRTGMRYRWNPIHTDDAYPWERFDIDFWSRGYRGEESAGPYTEVIK